MPPKSAAAARPKPAKLKSWSFSRYDLYNTCPLKLKFQAFDRLKEPQNEAMIRGDQVHTKAEAFIKSTAAKLALELGQFKALLKHYRGLYTKRLKLAVTGMAPEVETTWAFRADWSKTHGQDWDGCWLRIKVDAAWWTSPTHMDLDDWKTGKFREDMNAKYLEQLELYALGALLWFPHLEAITPRLRYVDEGLTFPVPGEEVTYVRADIPKLKKLWEKRTKAMMNDTKFAPKPNWTCPGCYFNKGTLYGWGKNKQTKEPGPCKF